MLRASWEEVGSISVAPVSPRAQAPSPLALSAVGLAGVAVVLVVLALAGLGGGGAAMVVAFVAFALAVVAKVKHLTWIALWLPLLLFPLLVVTSPLWV